MRGYGPKWHTLTSSGRQISILRVHGPKWHGAISLRAVNVFNLKKKWWADWARNSRSMACLSLISFPFSLLWSHGGGAKIPRT